jgi:hypothetical protein
VTALATAASTCLAATVASPRVSNEKATSGLPCSVVMVNPQELSVDSDMLCTGLIFHMTHPSITLVAAGASGFLIQSGERPGWNANGQASPLLCRRLSARLQEDAE